MDVDSLRKNIAWWVVKIGEVGACAGMRTCAGEYGMTSVLEIAVGTAHLSRVTQS